MNEYTQSIRGDFGGIVRRYEYDNSALIVADFGHVDGSVDVADGTAMIIVGDEQHEFDVPGDVVRAVMTNGVVTIEVER